MVKQHAIVDYIPLQEKIYQIMIKQNIGYVFKTQNFCLDKVIFIRHIIFKIYQVICYQC